MEHNKALLENKKLVLTPSGIEGSIQKWSKYVRFQVLEVFKDIERICNMEKIQEMEGFKIEGSEILENQI